jgi:hypothetical protein
VTGQRGTAEAKRFMPRKQRFKPSRKPKPPVVDGSQDQVVHPTSQEIEAAQPARQQENPSVIDADEGPK